MRSITSFAAIALAACPALATAQNNFQSPAFQWRPADSRLIAPDSSAEEIEYGEKRWQEIQFYAPARATGTAPLVVILANRDRRGRGYSTPEWLRYRANEAGFAVAFIPDEVKWDEHEERLENQTAALLTLHQQAEALQIDSHRIAIVGYAGNGALLGTREELLESAGIDFSSLRAVIGINGTSYDIEARMAENNYLRSIYRRAYGRQPEDYLPFSPAAHLDRRNAPYFLLLAHEDSEEALASSRAFASALSDAGSNAAVIPYPEPREGRLETYFMVDPAGAGREVIPFLQSAFGE